MDSLGVLEPRRFVIPEIVLGEGSHSLLGRYALSFGAKKAFLVTDPGVIQAGWTRKAEESLKEAGIASLVFDSVTPNPRATEVMHGADAYRSSGCDIIAAVGGGSPIDCAKGIGIVVSNNKHVLEFEGVDKVAVPGPPLICIPTTAGSSADVSQFAIVNDTTRKLKIAIISKTIVPDVALVDPLMTTTLSPELTAATGMDALTHAIEAYTSNASSPLTDMNALEAARLIFENLEGAFLHPFDMRYRNPLMLASMLAGMAFSNASLGLVHAMAHSLGGAYDLPHGMTNALLLEHVIAFNSKSASVAGRYQAICRSLAGSKTAASADLECSLAEQIRRLKTSLGIGGRLSGVGISKADISRLARNAMSDPCILTNPVEPTVEDAERIYERIF